MDFIPLELTMGLKFANTDPMNGFGWGSDFPYPLFIIGIIGIVGVAKLVQIIVRKSRKKQTV